MSCFIVSARHISALIQYALSPKRRERVFHSFYRYNVQTGEDWTPQELGALLQAENTKSWNARYREAVEPAFQFTRAAELSPVEILKAVQCYEYQSCEHDGWEGSDAHKIARLIYETAVGELPGYEQASWGLE